MPQTFFHAGEDRLVVPSFDVDDAIGDEAGLGDRGCEKIGARDAPQDLALGAGRYAGAEKRRSRAINRAVSAACDFMQSAKRETATGESGIHFGDSKGKHRLGAPASAFDPFDLRAQRFYGGLWPQAPY